MQDYRGIFEMFDRKHCCVDTCSKPLIFLACVCVVIFKIICLMLAVNLKKYLAILILAEGMKAVLVFKLSFLS